MTSKDNSGKRQLDILLRLLDGEVLSKKSLEQTYGVSSRTIQNDMAQIKSVLEEKISRSYDLLPSNTKLDESFAEHFQLQTEKRGHYYLKYNITKLSQQATSLTQPESLVLLKILLESRALQKGEIDVLLTKIIDLGEVSHSLNTSILNEKYHYTGVPKEPIMETLSLIQYAIENKLEIHFDYTKNFKTQRFKKVPEQLYFQDLYFYMVSDKHSAQDDRELEQLNKFKINNMKHIELHNHSKGLNPKDRFQVGVMRNQSGIWGYLGKPITLSIEFYYDPTYVLDRFPGAVIRSQYFDELRQQYVSRIDIPTNDGYGVKMWLLMQSDQLKILSPKSMRDYVIKSAKNMLQYYDEDDQKLDLEQL